MKNQIKDKWITNPAFYFDNASYMQTNTLGSSDFFPGSNEAKIYDLSNKILLREGIAAALG